MIDPVSRIPLLIIIILWLIWGRAIDRPALVERYNRDHSDELHSLVKRNPTTKSDENRQPAKTATNSINV